MTYRELSYETVGDVGVITLDSPEARNATEIGLLTELYWGLPLRTYIRTRACRGYPASGPHDPARAATRGRS